MLILAFDTTSEYGGAGIFRDKQCLALIPNAGPANRYSVTLFEMVDRGLTQAGHSLTEIDMFAAANGPGSFTGIRVGIAAARAWGKTFSRPARGISVLEALVVKGGPTSDWAFPILDARRGEFFLGGFRRKPRELLAVTNHKYDPADPGWVLKPDSLQAWIADRLHAGASGTCLLRAHDRVAADLRRTLPAALEWRTVEGTLVDAIAEIACRDALSGSISPNAGLDAYYIRRPDAEINWKD